jgi:hypothetical protein
MRRWMGILLGVTLLAGLSFANERGPSSPADRKRALEVIQKLEADPMSPGLAKDREWINDWVFSAPDVQVVLCTALIKPLLNERNSDPRKALMLQNLLSMAAFEMKSPEKAKDAIQMQMAGAEGMLRAYGNITRRMPLYKSDYMEGLRAKQESGKLEAYVREGASECRAHGGGTTLKP